MFMIGEEPQLEHLSQPCILFSLQSAFWPIIYMMGHFLTLPEDSKDGCLDWDNSSGRLDYPSRLVYELSYKFDLNL